VENNRAVAEKKDIVREVINESMEVELKKE
jgi:hypothetical protein